MLVWGHCLEWKQVLSGVPEESVLSASLSIIYTNDLKHNISKISKHFVSYNKHCNFQRDLDTLMPSSFRRCKCLRLGDKNMNVTYQIRNG